MLRGRCPASHVVDVKAILCLFVLARETFSPVLNGNDRLAKSQSMTPWSDICRARSRPFNLNVTPAFSSENLSSFFFF